ncbi:uncharacterized protein LOC131932536 [Physella acuta]|uniref:uncharacterized protein LOC131932536 n=1 Tax=Physella acuta TaxID=109671 RepID=UPI0027DE5293|nr:uncharacterized protein LOC131932536 [Physella acuta]
MEFNSLIAELRSSSENLPDESSDRSLLSSLYCNKACNAIDRIAEHLEYDNVITGLWLIVAHFAEQLTYLKPVPALSELCFKLFRQCAKSVLNIQWQNLEEESSVRQNFLVSLANLHAKLIPFDFPRFRLLESLTENPWTNPILAKVMGGEIDDGDKEEVRSYIEQEDPIILQLRVDMMLKENCEEYALNLCNSCLTHPELQTDLSVRKTQLSLLYKLGHEDKLQEECQKLSVQEALKIIRQLQSSPSHTQLCTVLAQTFMVQNWIRPSDMEANKELLRLWIRQQLLVDREQDQFKESVWAMAKLSQSTEQIVIFIDVLREECGDVYLQLYVDMCIFAINVDKGQMETNIKEGNLDAAVARRSDMASICAKLSCLCHHTSIKVARICALTSFALKPNEQSFSKIGTFYGQGGGCCNKCGMEKNHEPGQINPATLYEVERLLTMLHPEYLNPDNTYSNIHALCRRFLHENLKNVQQSRPTGILQRDVLAKSKTTHLFEALLPQEIQNTQMLLNKLRLQAQLPASSQPLYSTSSSRPNILVHSQSLITPKSGQASKSQYTFDAERGKNSQPFGVPLEHQHQYYLLKHEKNLEQRRKNVEQIKDSKIDEPVNTQVSLQLAQKHEQLRSTQVTEIIQSAMRHDSHALEKLAQTAGPEVVQAVLKIMKNTNLKQQPAQHPNNVGQSSSVPLQGSQPLPTVSTLLKPNLQFQQQQQLVREQPPPRRPKPQLYAQPIIISSSCSISTRPQSTASLMSRNLSSSVPSRHPLSTERNINIHGISVSSRQTLSTERNTGSSVNSLLQKPENLTLAKTQAVRQFMQMQMSAQHQKQISETRQMSGSTVTLNRNPLPTALGNSPSYPAGMVPSQLNNRPKTTVELAEQAALLKLRLKQQEQSPNVDYLPNTSHYSLPHQASGQLNQTSYQSQMSSLATLPSSDELSGSIVGIDDTIIKELLQDSGILANTFPDIEVENVGECKKLSEPLAQHAASSSFQPPDSLGRTYMYSTPPDVFQPALSQRTHQGITSRILPDGTLMKCSQARSVIGSPVQANSLIPVKQNLSHAGTVTNPSTSTRNEISLAQQLPTHVSVLPRAENVKREEKPTVDQLREMMKKEEIEGEVCMDAANNATYRCIICSLAFETLDNLREHVRNVCKPGLQQSSVYTTKINQDRANSAKAGVATTTVFQCLRCFELCVSDVGIKQHRLTCKRVPTVPSDLKKDTQNKSKSTPKTSRYTLPKKESSDNVSLDPKMPLPFPYPSLNAEAVLKSLSLTNSSKGQTESATSCVSDDKVQANKLNGSSISRLSTLGMTCNMNQPKAMVSSPPMKTLSNTSNILAPNGTSGHCPLPSVCSVLPRNNNNTCVGVGSVSSSKPCNTVSTISSLTYLPPVSKSQPVTNEMTKPEKKSLNQSKVTVAVEKKKVKCKKLPAPSFSEISGSGGSKFYKCNLCSQTLCSLESFLLHWQECVVKNKALLRRKSLLVSAKPLVGEVLKNVLAVIAMVAAGVEGPDDDYSHLHLSDSESELLTLQDPCCTEVVTSLVGALDKVPMLSGKELLDVNDSVDESLFEEKSKEGPDGFEDKSETSNRDVPPKLRDRKMLRPKQSLSPETVNKSENPVEKEAIEEASNSASESEGEGLLCQVCNVTHQTKRILLQHYAGKHLKPYTVKTLADSSSFFCHLCQKTFSTFMHYMQHVPNHSVTIYEKMKTYIAQKKWNQHSERLSSKRGIAKKGGLSPNMAKALKSRQMAKRSALNKFKRELLSSNTQTIRERLRLSKRKRSRRYTSSEDDYSSDASNNVVFKYNRVSESSDQSDEPKKGRGRPRKLAESSSTEDSLEKKATSPDEDYVASDDLDSDNGARTPPATRSRSTRTSSTSSVLKRRRRSSDSDTSENHWESETTIRSRKRSARKAELSSTLYDSDSNSTSLVLLEQSNGHFKPLSQSVTHLNTDVQANQQPRTITVHSLSKRQKEFLTTCDLQPRISLEVLTAEKISSSTGDSQSVGSASLGTKASSFLDCFLSYLDKRTVANGLRGKKNYDSTSENPQVPSPMSSVDGTEGSTISYTTNSDRENCADGTTDWAETKKCIPTRRCSVNLGKKVDLHNLTLSDKPKAVLKNSFETEFTAFIHSRPGAMLTCDTNSSKQIKPVVCLERIDLAGQTGDVKGCSPQGDTKKTMSFPLQENPVDASLAMSAEIMEPQLPANRTKGTALKEGVGELVSGTMDLVPETPNNAVERKEKGCLTGGTEDIGTHEQIGQAGKFEVPKEQVDLDSLHSRQSNNGPKNQEGQVVHIPKELDTFTFPGILESNVNEKDGISLHKDTGKHRDNQEKKNQDIIDIKHLAVAEQSELVIPSDGHPAKNERKIVPIKASKIESQVIDGRQNVWGGNILECPTVQEKSDKCSFSHINSSNSLAAFIAERLSKDGLSVQTVDCLVNYSSSDDETSSSPLYTKQTDSSSPVNPRLNDNSSPVNPRLNDSSSPVIPQLNDSSPVNPQLNDSSSPVNPRLNDNSSPVIPRLNDSSSPVIPRLNDSSSPVIPQLNDSSSPVIPQLNDSSSPVIPQLNDSSPVNPQLNDSSSPVNPQLNDSSSPVIPQLNDSSSPVIPQLNDSSPVNPQLNDSSSPVNPQLNDSSSPVIPQLNDSSSPVIPQLNDSSPVNPQLNDSSSPVIPQLIDSSPVNPQLNDSSSPVIPRLNDSSSPVIPQLIDSSPVNPQLNDSSSPVIPRLNDNSSPLIPQLNDSSSHVIPQLNDSSSPVNTQLNDSSPVNPKLNDSSSLVNTQLNDSSSHVNTQLNDSSPVNPKLNDSSSPVNTQLNDSSPVNPKLNDSSSPVIPRLNDSSSPVNPQLNDNSSPVNTQMDGRSDVNPQLNDSSSPVIPQLNDSSLPVNPQLNDSSSPVNTQLNDSSSPVILQLNDSSSPVILQLNDSSSPVNTQLNDNSSPVIPQLIDSSPVNPQLNDNSSPVNPRLNDSSSPVNTQMDGRSDVNPQLNDISSPVNTQLNDSSPVNPQLNESSSPVNTQMDGRSDVNPQLNDSSLPVNPQLNDSSSPVIPQLNDSSSPVIPQLNDSSSPVIPQLNDSSSPVIPQLNDSSLHVNPQLNDSSSPVIPQLNDSSSPANPQLKSSSFVTIQCVNQPESQPLTMFNQAFYCHSVIVSQDNFETGLANPYIQVEKRTQSECITNYKSNQMSCDLDISSTSIHCETKKCTKDNLAECYDSLQMIDHKTANAINMAAECSHSSLVSTPSSKKYVIKKLKLPEKIKHPDTSYTIFNMTTLNDVEPNTVVEELSTTAEMNKQIKSVTAGMAEEIELVSEKEDSVTAGIAKEIELASEIKNSVDAGMAEEIELASEIKDSVTAGITRERVNSTLIPEASLTVISMNVPIVDASSLINQPQPSPKPSFVQGSSFQLATPTKGNLPPSLVPLDPDLMHSNDIDYSYEDEVKLLSPDFIFYDNLPTGVEEGKLSSSEVIKQRKEKSLPPDHAKEIAPTKLPIDFKGEKSCLFELDEENPLNDLQEKENKNQNVMNKETEIFKSSTEVLNDSKQELPFLPLTGSKEIQGECLSSSEFRINHTCPDTSCCPTVDWETTKNICDRVKTSVEASEESVNVESDHILSSDGSAKTCSSKTIATVCQTINTKCSSMSATRLDIGEKKRNAAHEEGTSKGDIEKKELEDADDLSDFDLVIEDDTSSRSVVYLSHQSYTPKSDRNSPQMELSKKVTKSTSNLHMSKRDIAKSSQIDQQIPYTRGVRKLGGAKALKKNSQKQFEWDIDDDDEGKHATRLVTQAIPVDPTKTLNTSLEAVNRKRSALREKTATAPFTWDLEESCVDKTNNSQQNDNIFKISNALTNKPKRIIHKKRSFSPDIFSSGESKTKTRKVHSTIKTKDCRLTNRLQPSAKTFSSRLSSISKNATNKSSKKSKVSGSSSEKSCEEVYDNSSSIAVGEDIYFKTKSFTAPMLLSCLESSSSCTVQSSAVDSSKTRRSKKATLVIVTPEQSEDVIQKRSRHSSMESNKSDLSTSSRKPLEQFFKRGRKSEDPLTPKLKKAGLIKITPNPPASCVGLDTPVTRSSGAAIKALNKKSLRSREVNPLSVSLPQLPQSMSSNMCSKNNPDVSFKGKPLSSAKSTCLVGSTKQSPSKSKIDSTTTAAVVKRRTAPPIPVRLTPNKGSSVEKRLKLSQNSSTTVYIVDPVLPRGVSKPSSVSSVGSGTIHTPLPPGTVSIKQKGIESRHSKLKGSKGTKLKNHRRRV